MAWLTNTKTGKPFNTDWLDEENKKKYAQIEENKRQANVLNNRYTPLYHGSDYKSMLEILTTNKLIAQASPKDVDGDVAVSFARSLNNAYGDVAVEVSRESLQNNYSLRPIRTYVDPDEERTSRTISDLSRHIKAIRWVDPTRTGVHLKFLRRQLVENFNNSQYTNTPGNNAYYIKQIASFANERQIPIDSGMQKALSYIQKFDNREFDTERYNELKAKGRIK